LHDGGQKITLDVDGKRVCSSDASYGGTPEYVQKTPMANTESATVHISDMTACVNDKMAVKQMIKGQTWKLKGKCLLRDLFSRLSSQYLKLRKNLY
jgi:hypothetical protein